LAVADLGMAFGIGSGIATGHIVLMSGDPQLTVTALRPSASTLRTIKQNLSGFRTCLKVRPMNYR
jgi:cation transport ATPase